MEIPESLLRAYTNLAASVYIGERCVVCGKVFESTEDLWGAVWFGAPLMGGPQLVHKSCLGSAGMAQGPPK